MRADSIIHVLAQRRRVLSYYTAKKNRLGQINLPTSAGDKPKKFNIADFMDVVVLSEKKKA